MAISKHRGYRINRAGFTLLEMLLVVSLVLMLMTAMVFNFTNLARGNQLEEGTVRLETLMRFARAQAANSGRKVQIVFGNESTNAPVASTGEVRATWEPDPLGQPGCFSDLADSQWNVKELNDLVQVESVKVVDSTACKPAACPEDAEFEEEGSSSAPTGSIAPITFYPDGSSDSAEIIVAAKTPEEDQRMSVRLVGLTGSISHQLLTAETDAVVGESGLIERPALSHRDNAIRDVDTGRETQVRPPSLQPAGSGLRQLPITPPRETVGDTNSVDRVE